jgi:Cd2+/Zn2+-exporting ATPase
MKTFTLKNLDCATCAVNIEKRLEKMDTVHSVSVDFASATMSLDTENLDEVIQEIGRVEPDVEVIVQPERRDGYEQETKKKRELLLIALSILLLLLGVIFKKRLHRTPFSFAEYAVFLTAYILSGRTVLFRAGKNILHGRIFDENFLMTIATAGAVAVYQLPEAAAVMIFFQVGELMQDISVNRSRRSIKSLLGSSPDYANREIDGVIERVPPEKVAVGDTVVVKPGEKVPLDGNIIMGNSFVETSVLTGESVPRSVHRGDTVLAGMINKTGILTLRVLKRFEESSISLILDMVQNALQKKAKSEKFITRFAAYYTPAVVAAAFAIAVLPPLILADASFSEWIYRALVLLVISCPCALVISIPLGYFGGIGGASRRGILVKGSNYLDILSRVSTIVFDKTGTLTRGVFKVLRIVPKNGFDRKGLLQFAARVESLSNHPIAHSILEAYRKSESNHDIPADETALPTNAVIRPNQGSAGFAAQAVQPASPATGLDAVSFGIPQPEEFEEIAGLGIRGKIDGKSFLAGNDRLLHRESIDHDSTVCDIEGTVVHFVSENTYAGYMIIGDEIRTDAYQAIKELRQLGVRECILLTGDNRTAAEAVSKKLDLDSYQAELLPEEKVKVIEKLIEEKDGRVGFVGDGINDAPVIAQADVGLAMGSNGSDAAIDTADVVLMTGSPRKVAEAIRVSRKTRRIVWENIIFSLLVKGIFVGLGVVGIATMWEAVFADMGVALIAIYNATRILRKI